MAHIYCRVTMRHIPHSCGQALIYIHQWHEAGHTWVHVYGKYKIKSMRLLSWLYTMSIHFIWYYRQLLVHLISKYTNIDSLGHVSHHHTFGTHYHLLVDQNITYDGPLLSQELPNITLPYHNIMLRSRAYVWYYGGLFDQWFYIERGWHEQ